MDPNCIFCRIIDGQIPSSRVYEDEQVVAFLDIMPVNAGHVLIVPRRHVPQLSGMDEALGAHLFRVAMRLERAIRASGLPVEGTNLLQNNGAAAGQEVMHVHFHVIPRLNKDALRFSFPREMASREALDTAATALKLALSNEKTE